ncbi:hypothetical protein, partial [Alteromonas abrolhosensis]|uniref:hypothetical protein n=1 Tax=Alteromonas abrolhosensis TaxID=1892904 RepID=UPI003BAD5116
MAWSASTWPRSPAAPREPRSAAGIERTPLVVGRQDAGKTIGLEHAEANAGLVEFDRQRPGLPRAGLRVPCPRLPNLIVSDHRVH